MDHFSMFRRFSFFFRPDGLPDWPGFHRECSGGHLKPTLHDLLSLFFGGFFFMMLLTSFGWMGISAIRRFQNLEHWRSGKLFSR